MYLLQTRAGKRSAWAALALAVDMVREGRIDPATALKRLADFQLDSIRRSRLTVPPGVTPIATAVSAGIGVAVGRMALDFQSATALRNRGEPVILVRAETSTDDIAAIAISEGVLTLSGGRTSHAAVVARQLSKVCLVSCRELAIDLKNRSLRAGSQTLSEEDWLTLDGDSGRVYAGKLPSVSEQPLAALKVVEGWRNALADTIKS